MSWKLSVRVILVVVGLALPGFATSGGRGWPTPPTPEILSTTVDLRESLMVIGGRHFGSTTPAVTLGHRLLKVNSFSDNEVVVGLPGDIAPGTYSLTVTTNGPYRLMSRPFSAGLFTVAKQ